MSKLDTYRPQALAVLRIVTALLFIEHGTMKVFHFPAAIPGLDHLPPLFLAAAAIELIGGALILVGAFTRIAALIASGEMAVAYFMFHMPNSFWPTLNGGEGAIFFCFIFLYLVFAGAGAWSVDDKMKKA